MWLSALKPYLEQVERFLISSWGSVWYWDGLSRFEMIDLPSRDFDCTNWGCEVAAADAAP